MTAAGMYPMSTARKKRSVSIKNSFAEDIGAERVREPVILSPQDQRRRGYSVNPVPHEIKSVGTAVPVYFFHLVPTLL